MITAEKTGGFIYTSDRDARQRIDVDTEFAAEGMVCITAGPHAASLAELTLSEFREVIARMTETANIMERNRD